MKNIPIKFRAKTLDGKVVSGDLFHAKAANDETLTCIGNFETSFVVDPDSVAQLCGFDKNGNEVYECDTLLYAHGDNSNCSATAKLAAAVEVFCHYEELNGNFDYSDLCFVVKEQNND